MNRALIIFLGLLLTPLMGFAEPCEEGEDPNLSIGCEKKNQLSILKTAIDTVYFEPSLPFAASISSQTETPFNRPGRSNGTSTNQGSGRSQGSSTEQ